MGFGIVPLTDFVLRVGTGRGECRFQKYTEDTSRTDTTDFYFVDVFKSMEAGDSVLARLGEINISFTPSVEDGSENFIKQGYKFAKTLPEFEGAKDC